jgi:hypothetical protein
MKVFYFGCIKVPGHYMFASPAARTLVGRRAVDDFTRSNPWGYRIDAKLCPSGPEIEGRALLHHKDGWTALSFWDRSVDRRGRCNSNFLAEGTHSFEKMLNLAGEHFPSVVARFEFPIVEVKA